jgi:hypothetical protein
MAETVESTIAPTPQAPTVDELEGLLARLREPFDPSKMSARRCDAQRLAIKRQLAAAVPALIARIRALEEALRPFAREGRVLVEQQDPYSWRNTGLSNADLRLARDTLEGER